MTEVSKDELQRLRESEEKYRRMIELSNDAIFAIDVADGRVLEVNPRAEEMLGMTAVELVGREIWQLHAQDEQEAARELFRKTLKNGSGSYSGMTFVHADGSPVWVDISASVVTYGNMTVIQRICRDVSARHRLEIANRQLRKYYEHILDMMPVGLGVKKGVGKSPSVEFENRKLRDMFGDGDKAHHWCWSACADVIGRFENGSYVEEQTWPDGRVFQMTSSYYRDPDNTWRELQVVQDITERRHLRDELRRANEDLEEKVLKRTRQLREKQAQLVQSEKMASLGNLVAGIAHEINTPLGALTSNYDLFSRSTKRLQELLRSGAIADISDDGSDIAKILDTICKLNEINRTAAERIVSIVTSLRTFARLDQAEMDRVDIHEGLDSTLTLVGHELKGRIDIVKEYGDLPDVYCYPNQLNQVFMNILVNGAQAIDGKGTITIKTFRRGEQVVLEFVDSGKGINPEHLHKLFDPGFTTKGVGVGTGLGLSIVHQIVKGHGGELQVESRPGKGATFRVVLPVEGR